MEKSAIEVLEILKDKIEEYISLNFFNEDKIATNVKKISKFLFQKFKINLILICAIISVLTNLFYN